MKAAVFYGPKQPLKVEEVQTPKAGPGEILVKVAACGVCHTDVGYIDEGVPTFKKPPVILGHEASGIVAAKGEGADGFSEGDRVLVPAVFTCGVCAYCRTGRENICLNMRMLGNHMDGAYAEYTVVPAKDCLHMPEEIPLEEGCIIADAISTPYHAVKNRAKVRPGDIVCVYGCGGVGMNVVQVAVAAGALVVAVDVDDDKLRMASDFGAWKTVNAKALDPAKEVRKLTGGGADIAIEAIGNPATIEQAFSSLKTGGRLCIVGYTAHDVKISAARIMFREMEVVGSLGCRPVDYHKIVDMAKGGRIKVSEMVTSRFPLAEINDAFDLLRSGKSLRSIVVM
jgi:6-hydroxycyclohex-1-ene-1-carbonyl-CoA dehydrogenase